MNTLANELALVTGATRGIGREIALELGRREARVIGTATTAAGAQTIDACLREAGITGRGVVLDVADAAAVEACFKAIEAAEGTPSILVNNAGVTRDGLLMRMSAEDWQVVLDTDLGAVYRKHLGRHYPAMALVQVVALVEDRARLEIEATAVVPDAGPAAGEGGR